MNSNLRPQISRLLFKTMAYNQKLKIFFFFDIWKYILPITDKRRRSDIFICMEDCQTFNVNKTSSAKNRTTDI